MVVVILDIDVYVVGSDDVASDDVAHSRAGQFIPCEVLVLLE